MLQASASRPARDPLCPTAPLAPYGELTALAQATARDWFARQPDTVRQGMPDATIHDHLFNSTHLFTATGHRHGDPGHDKMVQVVMQVRGGRERATFSMEWWSHYEDDPNAIHADAAPLVLAHRYLDLTTLPCA